MYLLASELRFARAAEAAGDRDGALEHARAAREHARSGRVPAGVSAAQAAVRQLEARRAVAPG
jgi:hypothetical protein